MAIQLNRLSIGKNHLDGVQLTPVHKKRVESYLSNYFLNHKIDLSKQISFNFPLEKGPALKKIDRIVNYYRHMGVLPSKAITVQESALRDRTARAAIRNMHLKSIPGTSGQILAGARIAEDTLSVTRNILFATIGEDNAVVNHLGYYAGIMWTFFGIRETSGGLDDLNGAKEIGDAEGARRAEARIASGGIVTAASFAYLFGKISDTAAASTVATAMSGAANVLFGLGSVLAMGMSYLGWVRCHRFNERLNEYLDNPSFNEVQKLQGALRFLKDTISVTPEEIAEIRAQIKREQPALSPSEKEALLRKKLTHLAEIKVKYLKRRTSNKSLQLIMNKVEPLLAKLENETSRAEGIKDATILIQKVQNENRVKMSLFILGFVAAAISMVAMGIMTFMTAGALPFVLFGIAGAIYLAIGIYNAAGLIKKKDPDATIDLHPIQDLSPLEFHHG